MRKRAFLVTIVWLCSMGSRGAGFDRTQYLQELVRQQMEVRDRYLRATEAKRIEALARMPQPRWDDFDVTYYRLQLEPDFTNQAISGEARIGVRVLRNGLSRLGLDFVTRKMVLEGVGGAATGYQIRGDSLYLPLDHPYTTGDTLSVRVRYRGKPSAPDNFPTLFWKQVGGYPAVFSDNEPYYARCWFPCRDYPGDKADSVDVLVRVPKPLVVASNGSLRAVIDHGDGTWTYHWHESYPITTYLISMQVAAYRTIRDTYVSLAGDSMEVMHFVYPQSYSAALEDLSPTVPMIGFASRSWGEYPFVREKYGHAQYDGAWGGMENQTLTSLHSGYITGGHVADMVIFHELAHQWWGDWVSPSDFGHVWLNEGFATFAEALWFEHLYGEEGYRVYRQATMQSALRESEPIFRYPGMPVIVGVVYDKGACVLHMLRAMLGDSVFFAALRDYGNRFAYSTATTEQFQQVCEEHSGLDLGWFFRQWIYEPGHPVLRWAWTSTRVSETNYLVWGFVDQIQTLGPKVYRLPLEVIVTGATGSLADTVLWLEGKSTEFRLLVRGEPEAMVLDPQGNLLMETQEAQGPILRLVDWTATEVRGNGDGCWDPGETVELSVRICNEGLPTDEVLLSLSAEGEDIIVESASTTLRNVGHLDTVATHGEPFRLRAAPDATARLAALWLSAQSGPMSERFQILVGLGKPQILLVDDDGGGDSDLYYRQALARRRIYTHYWDVSRNGAPTAEVGNYPVLIWATGHARGRSLHHDEQELLRAHLARGGAVLLAGDDIGRDLMIQGDRQDSLFFSEVLRAALVSDSASIRRLIGVPNDPIGNRLFVYFEGPFGSPEPTSPEVVRPLEPAVGFLLYMGAPNQFAGIRWYDPQTGGRLVYLSFGLESVRGPYEDAAAELLERCLTWLQQPTGVRADESFPPRRFVLQPNHPNPFNPETNVLFQLDEADRVELAVVNLRGQTVRMLKSELLPPGEYRVTWDGKDDGGVDLPSGVYILRLKTSRGRLATVKAVKLR